VLYGPLDHTPRSHESLIELQTHIIYYMWLLHGIPNTHMYMVVVPNPGCVQVVVPNPGSVQVVVPNLGSVQVVVPNPGCVQVLVLVLESPGRVYNVNWGWGVSPSLWTQWPPGGIYIDIMRKYIRPFGPPGDPALHTNVKLAQSYPVTWGKRANGVRWTSTCCNQALTWVL